MGFNRRKLEDQRRDPPRLAMAGNKIWGGVFSGGEQELAMRLSLFILTVFVAVACIEKSAEAQNGAWCAYYDTGER